tara:strand:- start:1962 stop:3587 length:1626 start_codon:yes stop_codon:yes gene_type:complete
MLLKNSISLLYEFFLPTLKQFRKLYLSSSIYNDKISKIENKPLTYKPTLSILSCLIKYEKQKNKIEDFYVNSIWENKKINDKDYKKLHSFYWLFSIDLKSSKKITHSIIQNWIDKNENYNSKTWQIDTLSKRVIAWISNSKLTYEETENNYKIRFNQIVNKQINHLINEINKSDLVDDKMIGCTAIIMTGLSYNNEKFLLYGLNLLKKIINSSFDNQYFPKSRSIRQLLFYLKYFVLIRELLKESLNEIPDYLDEIIFYLGKAYNLFLGSNESFLFNGNHEADLSDFNKYLDLHRYKFKNNSNQIGGYTLLKNKNITICMDVGSTPNKKFSDNYQSGPLSFEIIFKGNKLICNSGYFQDFNNQLNLISKSTAAHSTLIIDNKSACSFKINKKKPTLIEKGFKFLERDIIFEKKYWCIKGSHDGYLKNYGVIHERKLEIDTEKNKIIGKDKLIKRKNFKSTNFEVRFHIVPGSKLTKTQDNKTVLIELENSGWKFYSNSGTISIESGLYFGKKNISIENQNIFINGITRNEDQTIEWEIIKI